MGKIFFFITLLISIIWSILSIYINFTGEQLLGIDKDKINSIISILGILITIILSYFCWKYPKTDDKHTEKTNNMEIGDNANNVIQINKLKIKK